MLFQQLSSTALVRLRDLRELGDRALLLRGVGAWRHCERLVRSSHVGRSVLGHGEVCRDGSEGRFLAFGCYRYGGMCVSGRVGVGG